MTARNSTDSHPDGDPDGVADEDLMVAWAGGSDAAVRELVGRHQKLLLNFFARMGASHQCEDLVQETFIRLFRYRDRYRPTAKFTSFLYHLARNVWADHGRKSSRVERLASSLLHIPQQPDSGPSREIRLSEVQSALDRLSPILREAVVLVIYQGLRYQEAAEAVGVPVGTVKSRVHLALKALKEHLNEDD